MKELSIEQKAKRYDEALERAKKLQETCDSTTVVGWSENIFPELKESEDERIRKSLIKAFGTIGKKNWGGLIVRDIVAWLEKQGKNNMSISEATKQELEDNLNKALEKETPESCNEFLEKQGEQKTADKVEPKFENGQWIVWQDKCYKVNYNGCGYELVDQDGLSTSLEYGTIDKNAHIWDITKDAKDGDVLACESGWACIFKALDEHINTFSSYCFMDKDK